MISRVKLPKLAETTDVMVLSEWLVAVGERVQPEQPLAMIETDKVSVELPSPMSGTVIELLVDADDEISTGDPVCVIEN
jgi:2-oxoglutarate dehydrogenase E2 component (dihydrolipoamide succinyltransferase)